MHKLSNLALAAFLIGTVCPASAQTDAGGQPGDPMRIAILVDNGEAMNDGMPQLRRALQQFVDVLPPNHELMLVTTGGPANIRVQPTRDYLEIREAIGEINTMRSGGNTLIATVYDIFNRFLRTAERRFPMIVVVSGDGLDASPRFAEKQHTDTMTAIVRSGTLVNAVLLTSSGTGVIRQFTLQLVKHTGGAYESATLPTALFSRLKVMATRIREQYQKVSPDRAPSDPRR